MGEAFGKGRITNEDTLKKWTWKAGKNPDALEKTTAAWNTSRAAGQDADCGRDPKG